jgi:hypothetical protein
MALLERQVAEDLLDDALAVVEGAADRQVVDVGSVTVVICSSWTAETLPSGWRMKMLMPRLPRTP